MATSLGMRASFRRPLYRAGQRRHRAAGGRPRTSLQDRNETAWLHVWSL